MACSGALATGITSAKGSLLGQSFDTGYEWESIRVQIFIPEKGYRYIKAVGLGQDGLGPILNEKGVGRIGFGRPSFQFPKYQGKPDYVSEESLMRTCGSAREWVNLWSENVTLYGVPPDEGGAIGRLLADPGEGFLLEGANWVYGDPANHAILGPMTDQVFACTNFYVCSRLKKHAELGIGAGYTRAKRVWELLIDRQYDCSVNEPGFRGPPSIGSGVTLPYFMSIFRDHGNLAPEEAMMSTYVPEERGKETVCCHSAAYRTKCAKICNPVDYHTNLLSCLWMTFGQPCLSPFLPVYIGVNSVPEEMSSKANPLARAFEDLRLALEYHPEFREKIKHFWTVFERQTIIDGQNLEAEAAKLAENSDLAAARALLTEFVAKKCADALHKGKQWVEKLQNVCS
jgi:hypothetical protein